MTAIKLVKEREHSVNASARFVLWVIAEHASDKEDGELRAWPSVATIVRLTGLSERRVQAALQELEAAGELVIERPPGRLSRYVIPRPTPAEIAGVTEGLTPAEAAGVSEGPTPAEAAGVSEAGPPQKRRADPRKNGKGTPAKSANASSIGTVIKTGNRKKTGTLSAQRSSAHTTDKTKRSLSDSGARDSSASGLGAGARALAEKARLEADRREVEQVLCRAVFEDAPEDRRTVPPKLAAELAGSRHARPILAAWAVEKIGLDCRKAAAAGKKPCNPLGLLVSAFGAQRHGRGQPWEVPIEFAESWERSGKLRAEAAQLQEVISRKRAASA